MCHKDCHYSGITNGININKTKQKKNERDINLSLNMTENYNKTVARDESN